MPIQTTYPEQFEIGFEGQLADGASDRFTRTYANPNADMSFGRVVIQGAADAECALPSAPGQSAIGITHFTHAWERSLLPDTGTAGIPRTKPANVLRRGRIVVVVETPVTPADTPHFRHANAGASPEDIGRLRADNAGGDATPLSGRFMTSAAAGEKAIFEFDLS